MTARSEPPIQPLRSVLYVPASNPRALAKAPGLDADGFILDLEDAVAPDAKPAARQTALSVLAEADFGGRPRVLRVNGLTTPWGQADLAAAAQSGADAVLIPKPDGPEDVRAAARVVAEHAPDGIGPPLWAMMETPLAILNARDIAAASPRLAGVVLGGNDLAKDLHATATPDRAELAASLGLVILAARAFGLVALDTVHPDLGDTDGFQAACRQAAAMGYDGKTVIHPTSIDTANRAFAPDDAAVALARRIIDAHGRSVARGQAVTLVEGRLVEALHVAQARRTVALADAIAARAASV